MPQDGIDPVEGQPIGGHFSGFGQMRFEEGEKLQEMFFGERWDNVGKDEEVVEEV